MYIGAFSQKLIRGGSSLCAGEQDYVHKRKQLVLEALHRLEIDCSEDSVPHIALLPSGGGQRAAVALLGSLHQMEKEALLGTLLYLGGVSGSTWSMASLYNDPEWSSNIDRALSKLGGPGVELEQATAWLVERAKEEDFSMTDLWGVLTSFLVFLQMDLRRLSEEADRSASNPYPVYCAIEQSCKWFEVTPHEAGFPELGLFIHTSLLGSKFESGQLLEKKLEMDMVKLQGTDVLFLCSVSLVLCFKNFLCRLFCFLKAICPYLSLLDWKMCSTDPDFLLPSFPPVSFLTKDILPLLLKWEWGTTNSFLYKYQDSPIPACLKSQQQLHLVDAGLLINVAYPSFLGTRREMDLIITLEYSAGNMFETLTLAKEYAAAVKKPFPEIHADILEDRVWPKDCYVFEGQGDAPSIVYMPLFNQQNCRGLFCAEFTTFQRPFNQQKINFLLETAKSNIQRNRDVLLREMKKAALSRQRKKGWR
uniref:PLA2c domain-containing protein n=1 Tax=Oryzias latipes TaxID=8090 RepID=A0A3P9HIU0_ORYLA